MIDREKKAKKKATASGSAAVPDEEPADAEADAVEEESTEVEKVNESTEAPVPVRTKTPKETGVRSRGRQRGLDSVPKVIRKRKKSINYLEWAGPAAAVAAMLLVILLELEEVYGWDKFSVDEHANDEWL
ncbi:unnamed protein product [Citrullus colocynthis]|uniref:Uncharacterized protein n=1 Tax=Citrullus colocynthis TaxID=252529 RepID=A0ABP0YXX1_9ROSI